MAEKIGTVGFVGGEPRIPMSDTIAHVIERSKFTQELTQLIDEFRVQFKHAGIKDVFIEDIQETGDDPCVCIIYEDLNSELLPETERQLYEATRCDLDAVRTVLSIESQRSADSEADMLLRAFEVLARKLDRQSEYKLTLVTEIDRVDKRPSGMCLEYPGGHVCYPLSYYSYIRVVGAVEWHKFLCGVTAIR